MCGTVLSGLFDVLHLVVHINCSLCLISRELLNSLHGVSFVVLHNHMLFNTIVLACLLDLCELCVIELSLAI
jgi:hypothetical protein